MLTQMRGAASSWVARGLIVFLGISFGAWGIEGIFRFAQDRPVAVAGSAKIRQVDFANEFQRELNRIRRSAGAEFDANTARAMGMDKEILDRMILFALFDQEAVHQGLVVSDSSIVQEIHKIPAFKGPGGDFNRTTFESLLRMSGYTEQSFVQSMRGDMLRQQALSPFLASPPPSPAALAEPLFRRQHEQRVAEYFVIPPAKLGPVAAPDEATLDAYYKANGQRFETPEYRKLTLLLLDPKVRAGQMDVPEDEIKAAYDSHLDAFTKPEKRTVEQFVVSDPAKADEAAAALKSGGDFAALAKKYAGLSDKELSLGAITRNDLPPEAADPIFAAEKGVVVGPVKTGLGTVFARVTAIEPGSVKSLDEVRGDIRNQLGVEKARDAIYEISRQIEDKRAGGNDVASIAKDLNLQAVELPEIDRNGMDANGKRPAALPEDPKILAQGFSTDQGQASEIGETQAGVTFLVGVDKVVPAAVKPLDEVKDKVIAAWTTEERTRRLTALASETADKLRQGDDAAKLAASFGAKLQTSDPLGRTQANTALGEDGLRKLFDLKAGEVFSGVAPAGAGEIVGRLARIVPVDVAAQADAVKRAQADIGKAMADDEMAQYEAVLKQRYGVTINHEAVGRAIGGSS